MTLIRLACSYLPILLQAFRHILTLTRGQRATKSPSRFGSSEVYIEPNMFSPIPFPLRLPRWVTSRPRVLLSPSIL